MVHTSNHGRITIQTPILQAAITCLATKIYADLAYNLTLANKIISELKAIPTLFYTGLSI